MPLFVVELAVASDNGDHDEMTTLQRDARTAINRGPKSPRICPTALVLVLVSLTPIAIFQFCRTRLIFDTSNADASVPSLGGWLSSPVVSARQAHPNGRSVLLIASVPRDAEHVFSLWSQLECLTADVDHVLVSAPVWAREPILEPLVDRARMQLNLSIDTNYIPTPKVETDRYDVGLWCEALLHHQPQIQNASFVTLINDSVYAIQSQRKSMETISHIRQHPSDTFDFVGLTYYQEDDKPAWPESILRTFTSEGIQKFQQQVCETQFRCGLVRDGGRTYKQGPKKFHRCIVDVYEVGIVDTIESSPERCPGLYPALPPRNGRRGRLRAWSAGNTEWHQQLMRKYAFPLQKVAAAESSPAQCIARLDTDWMNHTLDIDPPPPTCRRRRRKCDEIEREVQRLQREKQKQKNNGQESFTENRTSRI